ncbi:DEAD-box ATP-dependent RNA helicase 3, chloroplastic [Clydaea vesicula]|uniref:DEAD-box ATP-dependent RNA helicase 3, chloroplastic n=1 Tax=Clydaea vesicula TaxID=447962 RepID=A0AAD5U394_9FUNG|nr:DEAD-box ATP-dependent RNA helicase 3, chloroplastic [Clydaea vesicula]
MSLSEISGFIPYNTAYPQKQVALIYGLLYVVGLIANFIIVVASFIEFSSLTSPRLLLLSLCLSDVIFSLVVSSTNLYNYSQGGFAVGQLGCKVFAYFSIFSCGSSLLSCLGLTYDRYSLIVKEQNLNRARAIKYIIYVWIFVTLLASLPFLTFSSDYVYALEPALTTCIVAWESKKPLALGFTIICFIVIGLPLIFIGYAYSKVYIKVRKHAKSLSEVFSSNKKYSGGALDFSSNSSLEAQQACSHAKKAKSLGKRVKLNVEEEHHEDIFKLSRKVTWDYENYKDNFKKMEEGDLAIFIVYLVDSKWEELLTEYENKSGLKNTLLNVDGDVISEEVDIRKEFKKFSFEGNYYRPVGTVGVFLNSSEYIEYGLSEDAFANKKLKIASPGLLVVFSCFQGNKFGSRSVDFAEFYIKNVKNFEISALCTETDNVQNMRMYQNKNYIRICELKLDWGMATFFKKVL